MEHHDKQQRKAQDPLWQEFLRTGTVKAYLNYRRQADRKE